MSLLDLKMFVGCLALIIENALSSGYYERWLIPEAGHLFPREAPDAVIAAVQKLARLLKQQK